jgi:arylsulfatase A-like enzyme
MSAPTVARTLRLSLGASFGAALTTSLLEAALVLRRSQHVWTVEARDFVAALIALWGLAAIGLALVETALAVGLVRSGAVERIASRIRRIFDDAEFDRRAASWLIAGGIAAVGYGAWMTWLALKLIVPAHRPLVPAVTCAALATASLPLFAFACTQLVHVTAPLGRAVPRGERIPATLVAGLAGLLLLGAGALVLIVRHVDWRQLPLGLSLTIAVFFLLHALLFRWLQQQPAHRAPTGRYLLASALTAALLLPLAALPELREGSLDLLLDESFVGRKLAQAAQRLFDGDGDGWSTILGGGDCDDHDARIHPGARDWPDDGIDQNCLGGDAHAAPEPSPAVPAPGGFHFRGNVMIVFLDTLRAERVDERVMPNLDALARGGVRFRRAYAQAPGTSRSVPSFLTSRLPSQVSWTDSYRDYPALALDNRTLFEALQDGGFHTVGVASHFYFDVPGVTQGFDEFDNSGEASPDEAGRDVTSPRIVARVERLLPRLQRDGRRFALLVHLADAHAHYVPHPEVRHGGPEPTTSYEEYSEEVSFVDLYLGRLFDALKQNGLSDNTMIVVISDHGEAFGLHRVGGERSYYHLQTLYDDLIRVPLVFSAPGLAPREIQQPVGLIDLAPTVLDVLDLPIPAAFRGRSLAGALAGQPLSHQEVRAEILSAPDWPHSARALIDADGRSKIIYNVDRPRFEVYDLVLDPDERHDLERTRPRLAGRLEQEMCDWQDGAL